MNVAYGLGVKENRTMRLMIAGAVLAFVLSMNGCSPPGPKGTWIGASEQSDDLAWGRLAPESIEKVTLYRLPRGKRRVYVYEELEPLPKTETSDAAAISEILAALRQKAEKKERIDPNKSLNGALVAYLKDESVAVVFVWMGKSVAYVTPAADGGWLDTIGGYCERVHGPLTRMFEQINP